MTYSRNFLRAVILGLVLFLLSNSSSAQAESHLRVCKNGVVYYYFANNPRSSSSNPSFHDVRNINTASLRAKRRLTIQDLEPLIKEAGSSHSLPPSLIKAVIRVESNFNPDATSPKGAQGLMQLMPATADHLKVGDPYDSRENVWAGAKYLKMLLEKFENRLPLALAAYNAGPNRVYSRQEVPSIPETQEFVRNVCTKFLEYSRKAPPSQ